MKLILSLVILLISCNSNINYKEFPTVHMSETTQKLGIIHFKDVPFSGTLIQKQNNDLYQLNTQYHKGLKHGTEIAYLDENKLYWKRYYAKGEKIGNHIGWWPNGQLKFSYNFKNGSFHGKQIEWYSSGEKMKEQNFYEGLETGLQQSWRKNGKLRANYIVRNGRTYGVVKSRLCYSIKDGKGKFK